MGWKRKRDDRIKPRNPHALPSYQRKAGPMSSSNAPKGGSQNWRDLLDENETEDLNDSEEHDE